MLIEGSKRGDEGMEEIKYEVMIMNVWTMISCTFIQNLYMALHHYSDLVTCDIVSPMII
jgi:hypothetical protein